MARTTKPGPKPGAGTSQIATQPKQDNSIDTGSPERDLTLQRTEHLRIPQDQGGVQGTGAVLPKEIRADVDSTVNLMLEYMYSSGPRLIPQFGAPFGVTQAAGIHVLPIYIDELERDWGTDIWQRVLCDAVVASSDGALRDAILDKPLQILPAVQISEAEEANGEVPPAKHAQAELAKTVADFVRANLEELPGGFQSYSREMLEGISMGYKLSEQTYEIRELIPGNGPQTVLKELATRPQEAVSIVADNYNHVLGYIPRLPGSGMWGSYIAGTLGVQSEKQVGDTVQVEIPGLVPPEKVARFTWDSRNGDPRGQSHLRAAYVPWRLKIGLYPAYEAYLVRFAQPSAKLELGGGDLPVIADANGTLLSDPATIMGLLLQNLKNFQSGGAIVVPSGQVDLLQASGEGDPYLKAFELADAQIVMAVLYSNLNTQGGKYGTQALGEVHQDTTGRLVAKGKQVFSDFVREQIIRPLVRYNYGEEGIAVLPHVSFGETEQQDFSSTSGAVAQLKNAGLLFPSQYNDVFEMLHLDLLPQPIIDLLHEQWLKQLAASVAASEAQEAAYMAGGQEGTGATQNGPPGASQGLPGQAGGQQKPGQGKPGQQGQGSGKGQQPEEDYY